MFPRLTTFERNAHWADFVHQHLGTSMSGKSIDHLITGRTQGDIDLYENPDNFILEANVPGLTADDVDLALDGRTLEITARRAKAEEVDGRRVHVRERSTVTLKRTLILPKAVNSELINAQVLNGILRVDMPKIPAIAPRKITVN
jgi:HSP20 family protein